VNAELDLCAIARGFIDSRKLGAPVRFDLGRTKGAAGFDRFLVTVGGTGAGLERLLVGSGLTRPLRPSPH
jgi:hypothetical protein